MEISQCIIKTSQKIEPHEKRSKSERRLLASKEQVAHGQYVVSDTRCPVLHDCKLEWEAGQRPQRGRSPVEHRGNLSVHLSVNRSIHTSFCLASFCPGCPVIQIFIENHGEMTKGSIWTMVPLPLLYSLHPCPYCIVCRLS